MRLVRKEIGWRCRQKQAGTEGLFEEGTCELEPNHEQEQPWEELGECARRGACKGPKAGMDPASVMSRLMGGIVEHSKPRGEEPRMKGAWQQPEPTRLVELGQELKFHPEGSQGKRGPQRWEVAAAGHGGLPAELGCFGGWASNRRAVEPEPSASPHPKALGSQGQVFKRSQESQFSQNADVGLSPSPC